MRSMFGSGAILIAVLLTGSLGQAQLATIWGPPLAPEGCPVSWSIVNGGPSSVLWDPCGFAVFDADGNEVFRPECLPPVSLDPGDSFVSLWDQQDASGDLVPPGLYHLNGPNGPEVLVGGAEAAITPIGSRRYLLCSPQDHGSLYALGMSFAGGVGFDLCGLEIPLEPGPLLRLSLGSPNLFPGFRGVLDGRGRAEAGLALPRTLPLLEVDMAFVVFDPDAPCGIRRVSAPLRTLIL